MTQDIKARALAALTGTPAPAPVAAPSEPLFGVNTGGEIMGLDDVREPFVRLLRVSAFAVRDSKAGVVVTLNLTDDESGASVTDPEDARVTAALLPYAASPYAVVLAVKPPERTEGGRIRRGAAPVLLVNPVSAFAATDPNPRDDDPPAPPTEPDQGGADDQGGNTSRRRRGNGAAEG